MNRCAKLFYALMCLALVFSAGTGISAYLLGKSPMTHWGLMVHMSAAPIFAIALAGVAITWADLCRKNSRPRLGAAAKVLFWIILVCGFLVLLSGVGPMLPLFGTVGQHVLFLTHRWAGIALAVAVLLHLPALRPVPGAPGK